MIKVAKFVRAFPRVSFPTYSIANKFQNFYVINFYFEDTWLKFSETGKFNCYMVVH